MPVVFDNFRRGEVLPFLRGSVDNLGLGYFRRAESLAAFYKAPAGGTQALVRTVADAIATLTEAASRVGVFARTSADSLPTLAEVASRAGAFARSGADSLSTLAETATRAAMAKARTAGDSAGTLTESVARATMAKTRTSADSLSTLTEAVTRGTTAWARTGADTLSAISEAVFAIKGGAYRSTILADSPVAYWRFGESAGTNANDEAGTNDGTYTGGYTLGQTGALAGDSDTAVAFDGGTGWVSVPDAPALDLGDVLTIEAWVKRGDLGSTRAIISKDTNGYFLYISVTGAIVLSKANVADIVVSLVTLGTGWSYVVATKSGATTKLYINGVDQTGTVTNQELLNNASTLQVGQQGGNWYNGTLDEVALYGTALSGAQVITHYRAGGGFLAFVATVADSLASLTESVARAAMAKARTAGDSVTAIGEAASRAGAFARSGADSLSGLTEAVVRGALAQVRTAGDGLASLVETVMSNIPVPVKGLAVAISTRIHQALSGDAPAPSSGAASDNALGDADAGDS